MAENLGRAVLELDTKDQKFVRGVNQAERLAKNLDRKFLKLTKTIGRVGKKLQGLGTRLTIAITAPLVAVGVSAIKAASDIQELRNLTQVTFGESTKAVLKWSKEVGKAVGRSSATLEKAATEFGSFLKPLGVAPQLIAPMSQALGLLVTDLSSFRNISEEVALTRLFSGLAGETEAVRRLGIDIGQAALKQELLNLGIAGGIQQATEAQKVLARFNLIIRQTRDAQGDAARTSEAFENQLRRLMEALKDARIEIGTQLLPKMTELVAKFRKLVQGFIDLAPETQAMVISFGKWALIIGPMIFLFGGLVRALSFSAIGIVKLTKFIVGLIAKLGLLLLRIGAVITSVPAAIIFVVAAFVAFKDTLVVLAKGIVIALKNELVSAFRNKVVVPFQNAINAITKFLPDRVVDLLGLEKLTVSQLIPNELGDDVANVLQDTKEKAIEQFEDLTRNAKRMGEDIKAVFTGLLPEFDTIEAPELSGNIPTPEILAMAGAMGGLGKRLTETEIFLRKFNQETDVSSGVLVELEGIIKSLTDEMDPLGAVQRAMRNAIIDLDDAYERGLIPTLEEYEQLISFILDREKERIDSLGNITSAMDQFATQAARNIQSAFADFLFDPFQKGLKGMLAGFSDILRRMVAEAAAASILKSLFGTSGLGSFLGNIGKKFLGFSGGTGKPGREHGGRVRAGQSVVVGEKRAEVFRPDSAGRIIPSIAGGGVQVNLSIDASGADPSVLANMMRLIEARLIPQAIEGARSAVFSDLSRPEFA